MLKVGSGDRHVVKQHTHVYMYMYTCKHTKKKYMQKYQRCTNDAWGPQKRAPNNLKVRRPKGPRRSSPAFWASESGDCLASHDSSARDNLRIQNTPGICGYNICGTLLSVCVVCVHICICKCIYIYIHTHIHLPIRIHIRVYIHVKEDLLGSFSIPAALIRNIPC